MADKNSASQMDHGEMLHAKNMIPSVSAGPDKLHSGDNASSSSEILPQTFATEGLSLLGTGKVSVGDFLNNPGLGVPCSGGVFTTDLDLGTMSPGKMSHEAVVGNLNSLGDTQLSNAGIGKQVNANLPTIKSQGGQEH